MMTTEPVPQLHRWRAFAVLAVSFFMTIIDLAIVNVALPTIGRKLRVSESSVNVPKRTSSSSGRSMRNCGAPNRAASTMRRSSSTTE